jgi:predicted DNA-binding transcriptional regulator YafY
LATNKHAIIRYQALDKCFRNTGKRYFIEDLIQACNKAIQDFTGEQDGVKKRQVYEDIKFMESDSGFSINLERKKDSKRTFYFYSDSSFSINSQPINETEANQLKEALITLDRFKGLPQFGWIEELKARLDSEFNLNSTNREIIQFDQNEFLKGLEFITPIYNALVYKKNLEIEYKSFRQEKSEVSIISPQLLKQYNNRWFLFAYSNQNKYLINFALDRIIGLKESTGLYVDIQIDFTEHFEDVIGVSVPDSLPQKIVLKFSDDLLPYTQSKPMHGSQRFVDGNIELELKLNYELESKILSFGEGVKVIKPEILREKLRERINKMIKNF